MESPRIVYLGSPRGTGRPETGRSAERGAVPRSDESGRSPSLSLRLAATRPRSWPATARWTLFPVGARRGVSEAPQGWLDAG